MPSPFPGFDPYLEKRYRWRTVHTPLIVMLQQAIRSRLPKGFTTSVEEHLAVATPENAFSERKDAPKDRSPDITIFEQERRGDSRLTEKYALPFDRDLTPPEIVPVDANPHRFVRVYDRRDAKTEVVAVVELLSPTNKDGAAGTAQYRRKQAEMINAGVHLLEIDFLRAGAHTLYVPKTVVDDTGAYDYLVTLSDATRPDEYRFWRIGLRAPLPALELPLTPDVTPVPIDLQAVFTNAYDLSGLGDTVDYARETEPPLAPDDAAWADGLLRSAGLR